MKAETRAPQEWSHDDLERFEAFVKAAGEVEPTGLGNRIAHAVSLTLLREGSALIGSAAVKIPSAAYRRRVFQKAEAQLDDRRYNQELGWIAIHSEYRGQKLSRTVVDSALESIAPAPVFATSRASNLPMHRTLERFGFARVGRPYSSERSDEQLVLFVRDARDTGAAKVGSSNVE